MSGPARSRESAWAPTALSLLRGCLTNLHMPPDAVEHLRRAGSEHLPTLRQRRIDSLLYLACGIDALHQRVYDRVWGQQRAVLREVVGRLERHGVETLIIKGAEYLERWYGGHALGFMGDVDILVPRAQIGTAKKVLFGLDFRQATIDDNLELVDYDVALVGSTEANHYELVAFRRMEPIDLDPAESAFVRERHSRPVIARGDGCVLLHKIDVHHQVSMDVRSEELFARATASAHGFGKALSPADQLWVTLSRLYDEVTLRGRRYLRDFAYVLPMLGAPLVVDWDVVRWANREYGLRSSLYYFLSFLQRLGAHVPDLVLDEAMPNPGVERDFGWQLSGLFGSIDPFPLKLP